MAISNYTALKTAVSNWLHRTDLTANIPDFIQFAEIRLSRELYVEPLITATAVAVNSLTSTVALPANYLDVCNVHLQSNFAEVHGVPFKTIDRELGSPVSTPWLYTVQGPNLIVAPPASVTTTIIMSYYRKETVLTDANLTNWYMDNTPDLLLYASLLEAAPYLESDQRIPIWLQMYQAGVAAVNERYGSSEFRNKRSQLGPGAGTIPGGGV